MRSLKLLETLCRPGQTPCVARVAVTSSSLPATTLFAATKARAGRRGVARNLVWVLPVFALLAAVVIYPLANGLLLSSQRTTGSAQGEFVGFDNYVEALVRDGI